MAEQIRKQRTAPAKKATTEAERRLGAKNKGAELKAEIDQLLDEIDDVLESEAEAFVRNFVQRGGE